MLSSKRESRRTIATGRLVNRVLSNSLFFEGLDFSEHLRLNEVLEESKGACALLYPGAKSVDLETSPWNTAFKTVILLDGTWSEAKRMFRESTNLHSLPRFCFRPKTPSFFLVRKQPHAGCYSTIEAVHTLLNYAGSSESESGRLLQVFRALVRKQLSLEIHFKTNR
jgi:DTW domain-containing protein